MLVTTVGAYSSDSFVTLEEAETILQTSGMITDSWLSLTASQSTLVTGTVAGPFTINENINDNMLFSLYDDDDHDQTVVFTGTFPLVLTTSQLCSLANNQLSGITLVPNVEGKISIVVTNSSDTLYIKAVDKSSYLTLGLSTGSYVSTVNSYKEYMLKLAAQLIGLLPLAGKKVYMNQTLSFPRTTQLDVTIIPDPVKEAQALLACLVIQPNFDKQVGLSEDLYLPVSMQNAVVNSVKVAGIMDVKTSSTSSSSTGTSSSSSSSTVSSMLASLANVFALPVYLRMKPYLTQINGGALIPMDQYNLLLLDPVEEVT